MRPYQLDHRCTNPSPTATRAPPGTTPDGSPRPAGTFSGPAPSADQHIPHPRSHRRRRGAPPTSGFTRTPAHTARSLPDAHPQPQRRPPVCFFTHSTVQFSTTNPHHPPPPTSVDPAATRPDNPLRETRTHPPPPAFPPPPGTSASALTPTTRSPTAAARARALRTPTACSPTRIPSATGLPTPEQRLALPDGGTTPRTEPGPAFSQRSTLEHPAGDNRARTGPTSHRGPTPATRERSLERR